MVWKIFINPFHGNAKSNFDGYSAAKKQSPSNLVTFVMNASSKITVLQTSLLPVFIITVSQICISIRHTQ